MHADPALTRALLMGAPILIAVAAWAWRRPGPSWAAGALLATLWQLAPLFFLNAAAPSLGWWTFRAEGGLWFGVPVDLLVGWAVFWGAVPTLLVPRWHPILVVGAALLVDLLVIPLCRPVIDLTPAWLFGEALALSVGLLPGLVLARWTGERRNAHGRAVLQALGFGGLVLGLLPAAILGWNGDRPEPLLVRPLWELGLYLQLALLPLGLGLSAAQEFAIRGRGTPLPLDPPSRLVVSGPYAYMQSPMQVSSAALLLLVGVFLGSFPVACAAGMAAVFGLGVAHWAERVALGERFGAPHRLWSAHLHSWRPRWRPWVPFQATLYYDDQCGPCRSLAGAIARRSPVGLELVPARLHPQRDLDWLTYDPGGADTEDQGLMALCRALEHIHFGWALVSFTLRIPVIHSVVQSAVVLVGGGPHRVKRDAPGVVDASRAPDQSDS
jgi:hypothetical protein